ncbi:MAG TPA: OmcA/MtrC family decaheme c-type cytochrome, partial [Polyangiaceae bacterium]|nr:OmcA/MtrC family decaheme c-type cytochrome [Polyangiaceae bacterium]
MTRTKPKLPQLWMLLLATSLTGGVLAACGDDDPPISDAGGAAGAPATGGAPTTGGGGNVIPGVAGPGLVLTVEKVTVDDAGKATVDFAIADDNGVALDLDGYYTVGAVNPRFILSWLGENDDGESTQYTAYTLREVDAPDGSKVKQSSYDADGTFTTRELGKYTYTFATVIDTTKHAKLTHTLGAYATRTVGETRWVSTALHDWVPAGGEVTSQLDVVTDTACNSCHTRLEYHGGSRRGVGLCQLCHTESNSLEPTSGNTIDFQVMIHKIHRGSSLPSVTGKVDPDDPSDNVPSVPYVFGDDDDFSDVVYPPRLQDCGKCHQGSQGDRWLTRPSQKVCSSCHDRTYFGTGSLPAGWTMHSAGARDDSECVVCHSENSLYPVDKMHLHINSPEAPELVGTIVSVTNTAPGEAPIVKLSVTRDGTPVDVMDPSKPMNRLTFRIYGPNDESAPITEFIQNIVQEGGGFAVSACGAPLVAPCVEESGSDLILHTAEAIPADATGSWTAVLDGNVTWTPAPPGKPSSIKVSFPNHSTTVAVTDAQPVPRRQVVSVASCDECHVDLGFIDHHQLDLNFPD